MSDALQVKVEMLEAQAERDRRTIDRLLALLDGAMVTRKPALEAADMLAGMLNKEGKLPGIVITDENAYQAEIQRSTR